ncbi:MAG: peptide ABC transporter permease, partial [Frankiaceae bacterium]|nr:peptide ABC transporter permease [Frankiaceae bacterium]MBV9369274.1 peptide ABC transporter permease [Frankiales bacterium]
MTVPSQELIGTVTAESGVEGTAALDETAVPSRGRIILRRFLSQKSALFGLVLLVVLVLLAYVGPVFSKWDYSQPDYNSFLVKPNWSHLFGTDGTGTDLFAATMRGAQKSIIIGLLVAVLATSMAAIVGATAGYFG